MAVIEYKGFDHIWQYSGPWLYYLIAFYLSLPILAYGVLPYFTPKRRFGSQRKVATLFVLGDVGHSPRMSYHAKSLAKLDFFVTLCGYMETRPSEDILDDVNIDIQPIKQIKNANPKLPFLLFAVKKLSLQFFQLFSLLWEFGGTSDFIIIQNPPSIPILLLAVLYVKLTRNTHTKIIVDWHNLNYSILNLKYQNENHILVRILKGYERVLSKYVDYHITVTKQMKEFLIKEFGVKPKHNIFVLHDRPADAFAPLEDLGITQAEVLRNHELFNTIKNLKKYKILVSSTSFTADEDFNVLLDALKQYDETILSSNTKAGALPPLVLIVTGKGPLKPAFLARVKALKFSPNVIIKTAWLSFEDYPIILASADLAISLHTSSSGIDLPMKIVDFFGCGVPVVTLSFPAIGELVKDGVNGLVTKTKDGSIKESDEIYRLISTAFTDKKLYSTIKHGALQESKLRWNENWTTCLGQKLFD